MRFPFLKTQIFILPLLSASLEYCMAAAQIGPSEELMKNVSSPPFIKLLRFRVEHISPTLIVRTNMYIEGKWQSNAILVREVPSEQDWNNSRLFPEYALIGSYDQKYWYTGPKADWIAHATLDTTSPLITPVRSAETYLSYVLNIGIPGLRIGAIRWEGNRFKGEIDIWSGAKLNGEIRTNETSYPSELKYSVIYNQPKRRTNHFVLNYSYEPARFGCWPSTILEYQLLKDRKVQIRKITLLDLQVGSAPLPAEEFAPDRFVGTNQLGVFRQQGTNSFQEIDGKLFKVSTGRPPPVRKSSSYRLMYFIVCTMALFVVGYFALGKKPNA